MIVCFLHAKVGHCQALNLDYLNVVKQTLAMKIVRVFAFMALPEASWIQGESNSRGEFERGCPGVLACRPALE